MSGNNTSKNTIKAHGVT